MMTKTKKLLALMILAGVFFACSKKDSIVTETRSLASFSKLSITAVSNMDIVVEKSSSSEVIIETLESLLPNVQTNVDGGVLSIEGGQGSDPGVQIKIRVKTPNMNSLDFEGDGKVNLGFMEGNNVKVMQRGIGIITATINATEVNIENEGDGPMTINVDSQILSYSTIGSGGITFSGTSTNAVFEIIGDGNIHAYDLTLNELEVDIIGSGDMEVHVLDFMNVVISGEGSVFYKGNPEIDIDITGTGSVIDMN